MAPQKLMSMNANLPIQNNFPVLIFYRHGAPSFQKIRGMSAPAWAGVRVVPPRLHMCWRGGGEAVTTLQLGHRSPLEHTGFVAQGF
ncbi:hypothetical protein LY56_01760 [Roseinatronobacter thiooxidans]|uniref:Uncharacterized protein n=1 Tax=Roseinatronobacter thiooxidans TaxID=121821 RepID=A0A2W7S283_9RHOB|nr:hypothetical protein LY56_01760 [Roseinatronobacter thiooxidans]